MNLLINMYLRY